MENDTESYFQEILGNYFDSWKNSKEKLQKYELCTDGSIGPTQNTNKNRKKKNTENLNIIHPFVIYLIVYNLYSLYNHL